MCIFCNQIRKRRKDKVECPGSCEIEAGEESVRQAAVEINDSKILSTFSSINMKSKKLNYHHSCRKQFLNKAYPPETAYQCYLDIYNYPYQ